MNHTRFSLGIVKIRPLLIRPHDLVVDTPLGRLDSKHRQNILRYWTGEKNRQVILLSQDEEIDGAFLNRIRDHISKTYLLEHADVGDGIGRTTAHQDRYFQEEMA